MKVYNKAQQSRQKTKILVVMPSLYNGGAEKSLVNMLNEMDESWYDIDIILFKKKGIFIEQLPDFVHLLDTPNGLKQLYGKIKESNWKDFKYLPLYLLKYVGTAVATVFSKSASCKRGMRWKYFYRYGVKNVNKHYDVALAYISEEVLYYVSEKVNADKKIVWIHNDYVKAGYSKQYDYPHLKNMDNIVSVSDKCVDILKQIFPEFKNKTMMLPNITSSIAIKKRANEFYPMEFEKQKFQILSIGRLHEQKGFDIAIHAAHMLKEKGNRFAWYVIGTGEQKEELIKQIQKEGVENYFILLGARENPYPYIRNCNLFVQPSRYEGKSVVLDEAKILAKPILVTNYPTVYDQVEDGKEGIITEMDAKSIAECIEKFINSYELRQGFSNYLVQNDYGNQSEIKEYCKLINEVSVR